MDTSRGTPTQVDLLISGGTILTMDPMNRIIENGAVAIRGDTILAIGPADILAESYVGRKTYARAIWR